MTSGHLIRWAYLEPRSLRSSVVSPTCGDNHNTGPYSALLRCRLGFGRGLLLFVQPGQLHSPAGTLRRAAPLAEKYMHLLCNL